MICLSNKLFESNNNLVKDFNSYSSNNKYFNPNQIDVLNNTLKIPQIYMVLCINNNIQYSNWLII